MLRGYNNNLNISSNPTNQLTNSIASTSSPNQLKLSSTDALAHCEATSHNNSMHCQSLKNNQIVAEPHQRSLIAEMNVSDFQPSEYRVIDCNYTNCTYDKNGCCTSSNRPLATTHSSLPRDYDPYTYANCSDDVAKLTSDVASFAAILPPPLFDESNRLGDNVGGSRSSEVGSSSSKIASSRRHHRTIPRRFATSETPTSSIKSSKSHNDSSADYSTVKSSNSSSSSNHKINGKPICQCPVQHVPMSYMGASHFTPTIRQNPPTDIYMPAMSTKVISSKPRSSRTPRHSAENKDNSCGTNGSGCTDRCSQSGTLRSSKSSGSGKISTISKKMNSDSSPKAESLPSTLIHSHHTPSAPKQNHVAALLDPLAVPNLRQQQKHHSTSSTTAISKCDPPSSLGQRSIDHPVLPPKLHRNRTSSHQPTLVPRIHTISKPAGDSIATSIVPIDSMSTSKSVSARTAFVVTNQQLSQHTKSLPRSAEDKLKFLQPVGGELQSSTEKAYSLGKINYTNSFPKFSNHYELPKAANGKISMISDVVSKVPSIINIPSPVNRAAQALNAAASSSVSMPNAHSASFPSSPKFGLPLHTPDQSSLIAINVKQSLHASAKKSQPHYPDHGHHRSATASLGATPAKRSTANAPTSSQDHRQPQSLPVCTTYKNCSNPKEHFLPNDTSIDDEYLSECENCKSAHGSRYYLDEPAEEQPQETMTLQRKIEEKQEDEQTYYRASSTLPTNTKQKQAA